MIDILSQISKKSDIEILKVAGVPLEIAGKVYSWRVDDVHAQWFQLSGRLARNFATRTPANEGMLTAMEVTFLVLF